ncbi:MAG: peroxiredoxin [Actinomycetota bacterium]
MTQLHEGDPAPDFELRDGDGKTWRLSRLRGDPVVVYFYPADDTPGCTRQACDFRDARNVFQDAGYTVLGISPQGARSHRTFTQKYALNFPLLIDEDYTVAQAYGVKATKRRFFKNVPLDVVRSTFVVDREGRIAEALYGVSGKGHVAELRGLLEI